MSRQKHPALNIPPGAFDGTESGHWDVHPHSGPTGIDRWLLRKLLAWMGNPPIQFVLWNGERILTSMTSPVGHLHLRDHSTIWQLALNPELNFGDAFCRSSLEVEGSLVAVLEAIYRATSVASHQNKLIDAFYRRLNRARSNTRRRSRTNVQHHYNRGRLSEHSGTV